MFLPVMGAEGRRTKWDSWLNCLIFSGIPKIHYYTSYRGFQRDFGREIIRKPEKIKYYPDAA